MPRLIEIAAGDRYGKLSVIGETVRNKCGNQSKRQFLCQCDCGTKTVAQLTHLRTGHTVSCGCYREARLGDEQRTHGMRDSATYASWVDMKTRCTNPAATGYQYYGGRGIAVCQRWLDSFDAFLEDMGECPAGLTIDRIDSNKNYEPGNCQWATMTQQARNRRSSRMISHDGRTQCLAAWSEETGIPKSTISNRLRLGWSASEALST